MKLKNRIPKQPPDYIKLIKKKYDEKLTFEELLSFLNSKDGIKPPTTSRVWFKQGLQHIILRNFEHAESYVYGSKTRHKKAVEFILKSEYTKTSDLVIALNEVNIKSPQNKFWERDNLNKFMVNNYLKDKK